MLRSSAEPKITLDDAPATRAFIERMGGHKAMMTSELGEPTPIERQIFEERVEEYRRKKEQEE